ncbi:MAG: hypothetical protein IID44_13385 [Planctomycetes bacterium]|nr:hypothetical protein [Planctomycetota bacterium]
MSNPFDEAVDIQLEFDGRILRGQYQIWNYPTHRELCVYYNGRSDSATLTEDTDNVQLAMQLFQQVVRNNYTRLDRIDADLPTAIREAAFHYVNDIEDDHPDNPDYLLSHTLVESFGDQSVGSLAHRRVSWLCVNVLKCVIPAWSASCDHPTAEHTFDQLVHHLRDGVAIDNWDDLCRPAIATRDGHRIVDCVACMVEPIAEGVANTAKYLRHGEPRIAGDVIWDAWCAQSEGAWRSETVSFQQWVVLVALPAALDFRELEDASIYA